MTDFQPLAGISVVDLSSVVMGPLGTQILADMGADVIAIETVEGDANRHMGPGPHPDLSGPALNLMRNKRSIVLDIRDPKGYAILQRMVARADAFVTNLRPGSRKRAGVTYDVLRQLNSNLVYCAAAGYRADSSQADEPAYDDIVQAAVGLVDIAHRSGLPPVLSPTLIADKVAGMAIAQAVTAGLLNRARTGEGVEIQLAMYDLLRAFVLVEHGGTAIPEPPYGPSGYVRLLSPERRPLRTTDGLVTILAYERHHFEGLMRIGGRQDMLDDPRFLSRRGRLDHIGELYRAYQECAETMTTAEFLAKCREYSVPAHRVVTLDEIVADLPVVEHPTAGMYRMTPSLAPGVGCGNAPRLAAPLLGQHGREILAELGCGDDEISDLELSGALGYSPGQSSST